MLAPTVAAVVPTKLQVAGVVVLGLQEHLLQIPMYE